MRQSFFRRIAEEKEILNDFIQFEHDGYLHLMNVEKVVDIIESLPYFERRHIKYMLSKIDLYNGNIKDYFEFVAKAYIMSHYSY